MICINWTHISQYPQFWICAHQFNTHSLKLFSPIIIEKALFHSCIYKNTHTVVYKWFTAWKKLEKRICCHSISVNFSKWREGLKGPSNNTRNMAELTICCWQTVPMNKHALSWIRVYLLHSVCSHIGQIFSYNEATLLVLVFRRPDACTPQTVLTR